VFVFSRKNITFVVSFYKINIMAVLGITVERTSRGVPQFVTIDLRKHNDFIPLLEKKGVVLNEEIQWTAKMKRSFEQAEKGDWVEGDINKFWDL